MKLSTGRELYTQQECVIGIGLDCDELYEGFDNWLFEGHGESSMTTAEKLEIADEMIRRWTVYRNAVLSNAPHQP